MSLKDANVLRILNKFLDDLGNFEINLQVTNFSNVQIL